MGTNYIDNKKPQNNAKLAYLRVESSLFQLTDLLKGTYFNLLTKTNDVNPPSYSSSNL